MPPQHGVNRRCDCKQRTFLQRNPALRSSLCPCADAQTSIQSDQARIPYPRYAAAQACILRSSARGRSVCSAYTEQHRKSNSSQAPPRHGVNRRFDCKQSALDVSSSSSVAISLRTCADEQTCIQSDQASIPYPCHAAAQVCIHLQKTISAQDLYAVAMQNRIEKVILDKLLRSMV